MTLPPFNESLLILSDVHLGNDLNDLTRDGARRSDRVDSDLANLLAHYRRKPSSGRCWRLVIAGDFIDFIGMAIFPRDGDLDTEPSAEERAHGLGNASEDARVKLRAVAARHAVVFEALADFIDAGHAVTIVHGNHDVEFHWDAVKQELRAMLLETALRRRAGMPAATVTGSAGGHTESSSGSTATRNPPPPPSGEGAPLADFAGRIEFAPWFYYVGGVAYVEHGHQYDMLCSTAHVMAPLSPVDPRHIARSFSDVFLRWVVRPTSGVPEYGHERMGVIDYVLLGARMGAFGLVRLAMRFVSAIVELFRLRRAYLSEAAQVLRVEHERRMGALAEATRVGIERLRALAALQAPPVTQSVSKILASLLLDRLALALAGAAAIAAIVLVAPAHTWRWPAVAAVAAAWVFAHARLRARRREWFGERLDNDEALVERAGHLAHLFPAAFVVMGHTHVPAMVPVAQGTATYVNVGSWHEAENHGEEGSAGRRAARTHLVIHPAAAGLTAEFLAWSPEGPLRFVDPATHPAPVDRLPE